MRQALGHGPAGEEQLGLAPRTPGRAPRPLRDLRSGREALWGFSEAGLRDKPCCGRHRLGNQAPRDYFVNWNLALRPTPNTGRRGWQSGCLGGAGGGGCLYVPTFANVRVSRTHPARPGNVWTVVSAGSQF